MILNESHLEGKKKRRLWMLADLSAVFFAAFLVLAILTILKWPPLAEMNSHFADFAVSLRRSYLNQVMIAFSDVSSPATIAALFLVMSSVFAYRKRWQRVFEMSFAVLGGLVVYTSAKYVLAVSRPENPLVPASGYSFPSGHASMSAIFFSVMVYFFFDRIKNRLWRTVFVLFEIALVLTIGFSRIYLGVHRLSEVFAGFAIGLAWFCFSLAVTFVIFHGRKERY